MASRLAIANQKGGVGKTTTAMNLASIYAIAGRKTLLLDLDPQGNATTGLGMGKEPGAGASRLLSGKTDGVVYPTALENLHVVPASPDLQTTESALREGSERRTALREALDRLAVDWDEILVDCPPSMGGITRTALGWVDRVLVPIQCEFFSMEGLTQILAVIDQVREKENPQLALAGVLLTMYDPSLQFHREVVENLAHHMGEKLCRTVIPRDVTLAEAASHGVPVVEYDSLARGTFGYVELGKEMMGHGRKATG